LSPRSTVRWLPPHASNADLTARSVREVFTPVCAIRQSNPNLDANVGQTREAGRFRTPGIHGRFFGGTSVAGYSDDNAITAAGRAHRRYVVVEDREGSTKRGPMKKVLISFPARRDRRLASVTRPLAWHSTDPRARFATDLRSSIRLHLVVEQLPESNGWDWVVWPALDMGMVTRTGKAPCASEATSAAETAANCWIHDASAQPASTIASCPAREADVAPLRAGHDVQGKHQR
jgi:hypothetical protein